MSAIAGFWGFDGHPGAAENCERILAAQRMYGPHGTAQWNAGHIALGRSLHRLLPEDRFDSQPLIGGGGRFVLVADVRLDNREDLVRALAFPAAAEAADAALLMAAWERWQDRAFDQLYGDYAFALWDAAERHLILARDALGGRPLHYHRGKDFIAFASMPKGLLALDAIPSAPDEARALEFLALMPEVGPRSFFANISRVELGQVVTITPGGNTARVHWTPSRTRLHLASNDEYIQAARHELDRAVAVRLRGTDGHVGAHLSAGFDSAGVTATAARLLEKDGGRVTAFTAVPRAGYDAPIRANAIGDESELAQATAAHYPNVEHVLVRPDGRTIFEQLDRDFYLFDRPLANPHVWQFWNRINAEAQQRGLRVVLNGGFGNISLSYAGQHLFSELAGSGRLLRLFREAHAAVGARNASWANVLGWAFGARLPGKAWRLIRERSGRIASSLDVISVIRPERFAELEALGRERGMDFEHRMGGEAFAERLSGLRRIDFGNNRKGVLAGWGVDMRDPTADRKLIEFCLSVPTEQYAQNGELRALARGALADRVPARVLDERRRGAQSVDWHEGLTADRERLRDEITRLEQIPAAAAALDLPRMRHMVEDWPAGGWHTDAVRAAYCFALLRGAALGQFVRKASRSNV